MVDREADGVLGITHQTGRGRATIGCQITELTRAERLASTSAL
ncbi:hypothetical protein [Streptomyces sp. NPDC051561]